MSDDLAQELIKAQAAERMALADMQRARDEWNVASKKTRQIVAEIGRRAWVAAGVTFGETVLYMRDREHTKYLAVGVNDYNGDLIVRAQTKTGGWFKRTNTLYQVKPSDVVIVK